MILAETMYGTHNVKLLAIIETFKTWNHHLEESQHEVLIFTNHNNLRRYMDTKSFSSKQVYWVQELSRYHFWINYYSSKAKWAINVLFQYS